MNSMSDVPRPILAAQRCSILAREVGELSIEIIEADEGGDRKRIADRLRAIADALEGQ